MIEKNGSLQVIRAMQEHIAEFTDVKASASLLSLLTNVNIGNEYFRVPSEYEILFNPAGAKISFVQSAH